MRFKLVFACLWCLVFVAANVSAHPELPDPIDTSIYTTVIDAENAGQLKPIALKAFPEYFAIWYAAVDSAGRFAAGVGQQLDSDQYWISVWDTLTGEVKHFDILEGLPFTPEKDYQSADIALSPDGTKLAAIVPLWDVQKTAVRMWDIESGNSLFNQLIDESYIGHGALKFSPDGQFLVATVQGITWWDVASAQVIHTITYQDYDLARTESDGPPANIRDIVITPGNRMYIGQGGAVYIWDMVANQMESAYTMTEFARFPNAGPDDVKKGFATYPDIDPDMLILALSVSPDERFIATSHRDGVRIWDTQSNVWGMSPNHWSEGTTLIGDGEFDSALSLTFNPLGDVLFIVRNQQLVAFGVDSDAVLARYDYPHHVLENASFNAAGTLLFLSPVHPDAPETGIEILAVSEE